MNFRSLLVHSLLIAMILITPATAQTATIKGSVFEDANANGKQDDPNDEPGIPNVSVVVTDVNKMKQTVVTDQNGMYQVVVPPGTRLKVNVDDTTLPPGYLQTAGYDPSKHSASLNTRLDGYCWPAPLGPTDCCANKKKKVKINKFLNLSGDPMSGAATIDHSTSMWESEPIRPPSVPSDGIRYDVFGKPGSGWLRDLMETPITIGFNGTKGGPSYQIDTQVSTKKWHIKKCGKYKVRVVHDLINNKTYVRFGAKCKDSFTYKKTPVTSFLCWELVVGT